MIVERMTDLIGNTPLLKIPADITGLNNIDLYAKLEMLNPFGSVKDRIAWAMLKDDIEEIVSKGQTIFENSSGNTAKAIAAIAGQYGVPFKQISAMMKVAEGRDVLRLLGAELEEFAAASDCFDPSDPNDPQFLIEKAVRESGGKVFFTSQFTNKKNPQIHEDTTAKEILDDLGRVDFVVSGLGTSGSTLGLARAFGRENPDFTCIGLVTEKGSMVPGLRALDQMWESGIYQEKNYHSLYTVNEKQALDGMLVLNRRLGVLCGPSAGANFSGAVRSLKEIDASLKERKNAVFIVCDRIEWYISYVRARLPEIFGEEKKLESLFHFSVREEDWPSSLQCDNAEEWIAQNKPLVIDIRSPIAYRMSTIEGAINISIDLFEKMIDGHSPFPKERPILLLCAIGEKTRRHAAYLHGRGYKAFSLAGGILAWRNAGKRLEKMS